MWQRIYHGCPPQTTVRLSRPLQPDEPGPEHFVLSHENELETRMQAIGTSVITVARIRPLTSQFR